MVRGGEREEGEGEREGEVEKMRWGRNGLGLTRRGWREQQKQLVSWTNQVS